jgi:hypothetical protein
VSEGRRLPCWEARSGETIVAIADGEPLPTRAHALLAKRRRLILFALADAGTPQEAAHGIGAAVAALGIERFDLMGEGPALRPHCGWRSRPPRRTSATTPSSVSCRLNPTKRGSKPSQRDEGLA